MGGVSSSELAHSISKGDVAKLRQYLKDGKNPHINIDNQYLIHFATSHGNRDAVRLLLDYGIDIDSTDNEENTPLLVAGKKSDKAMVEYLIDHNANADAKNNHGDTIAHIASDNNDNELVSLLASKNVNINHVNIEDDTPLDVANKKNNNAAAQALANNGGKSKK